MSRAFADLVSFLDSQSVCTLFSYGSVQDAFYVDVPSLCSMVVFWFLSGQ